MFKHYLSNDPQEAVKEPTPPQKDQKSLSSHPTDSTNTTSSLEEILTQKDRQMLMELGFVASVNFLPWEAHALFGQLMLADPQKAYGRVGLAYCKIMGGQFPDAHKLLESPIVKESQLADYGAALQTLAFQLGKENRKLQNYYDQHRHEMKSPEALQLMDYLINS